MNSLLFHSFLFSIALAGGSSYAKSENKGIEINGFKIHSSLASKTDPEITKFLHISFEDSEVVTVASVKDEGQAITVETRFVAADTNNDGEIDYLQYESPKDKDGWTVTVTDYEMDGNPDRRFHLHDTKTGFAEIWYADAWRRVIAEPEGKYSIVVNGIKHSVIRENGRFVVNS